MVKIETHESTREAPAPERILSETGGAGEPRGYLVVGGR